MYNPSYLIKSRHDIYYFRYPLPSAFSSRVSISLKTRCPKEALLLSKMLEYHSIILMEKLDFERMDHAEIKAIISSYYADQLEDAKALIDKEGPLSQRRVDNITDHIKELNMLIDEGHDDMLEALGLDEYKAPDYDPLKKDLQGIMDSHDLSFIPQLQTCVS